MSEEKFTKRDITFNAEGTMLKGWLYVPTEAKEKYPTIVMAHGFGAVKEMYLDDYAKVFASNGLATLVYDNRNFGESEGERRQEINVWQQVEDYRHAITFATSLKEVDENRIGVWGSSLSGGHVLVVAATDRRVKCVVSQVPTISGLENAIRKGAPEKAEALTASFSEDRLSRMQGREGKTLPIIPSENDSNGIFPTEDAVDWYSEGGKKSSTWKNYVTFRSIESVRTYEPGQYVKWISPTPLLMVVAKNDYVTPADLALRAYENALEPKRLVLQSGGHFDAYVDLFEEASSEAMNWFKKHL